MDIVKLKELIKRIDQASYVVPAEVMEYGTRSGIPLYYTKGITSGRLQAIEFIKEEIIRACVDKGGHIYEGVPNGIACARCYWTE